MKHFLLCLAARKKTKHLKTCVLANLRFVIFSRVTCVCVCDSASLGSGTKKNF